jgi:hypothetical protein
VEAGRETGKTPAGEVVGQGWWHLRPNCVTAWEAAHPKQEQPVRTHEEIKKRMKKVPVNHGGTGNMAQIIEFPHNDSVVQIMHKYHVAMTRENYLQIAYFGDMPEEWTGAHEDELPAALRDYCQVGRTYARSDAPISPPRPPYRGFGNPPLSCQAGRATRS